jgi:2-phospho-L-lactate guanylyltransferase
MSAARTCVLVPMKPFGRAKSRLRGHLDDAARSDLARRMFESVLTAARNCDLVHATYVITTGTEVAKVARALGAEVLQDPEPALPGLGALLDWGIGHIHAQAATRALVLMADLPALEAADVCELCALLDDFDVVAAPDRHERSTNALALRLPYGAATAFGHPDSYAAHRAQAQALGLSVCELRRPRLAHDLDVAADM